MEINIQKLLDRERKRKFNLKRNNAKYVQIEFSLVLDEIVWPTHCPVLGIELDYFSDGHEGNSISFDRKDSSKGYTKENVNIISWRANRLKDNGTAEEHRKIAEYMSQ